MDDISTVAAAMAMDWDASGKIARARFAFGGVAAIPLRACVGRRSDRRSALERSRGGACASGARSDARADQRSSRLGRISAGRREEPDREIPVGAAGGSGLKIAGQAIPHESAREHVTGDALYTDDLLLRFPRASARLAGAVAACACAGQDAGCLCGSIRTGRRHRSYRARCSRRGRLRVRIATMSRCFPTEVMYHSQPVAWVLGETLDAAQRGASRVAVEYEPLPAILTIEDAIAGRKFSLRAAAAGARRRVGDRIKRAAFRRRAGDRRPGALLSGNAMRDCVAG